MQRKPHCKFGTYVFKWYKPRHKWLYGKTAVSCMKIMLIPVKVKRGKMSMDKSSNGDQNFYPHKSEMVGKNVKDDVNMSKINSTMTKGECLPDPCDVVCSLSTSDEDTDDTSNKVVTIDDPRMDWLMFKYKKPADAMLPTHMEKGIKSFAYYLFLVAFLWILWPHENENVFIYGSRRECFETKNIKFWLYMKMSNL